MQCKITVYYFAKNKAEQDNSGEYYAYTVILEFPASLILPVLTIITAFIVILARRKRLRIKSLLSHYFCFDLNGNLKE